MKKLAAQIGIFLAMTFVGYHLLHPQSKFSKLTRHALRELREEGEEDEDEDRWNTDAPDKFLEYHRGIRTRSDQEGPAYPSNYKWHELQLARVHQASRLRNGRTKSNGVIQWDELGPGNVPGRTRALYEIPGDPNKNSWLAGAATGGIWRTTNGGATWTEVSKDFPVLPISSFAGDASGSVIYAGSGEFVSSIYSALGNGIFKSTDKGITWAQLPSTNNPDFAIITRIIADPSNANNVLATTAPHNLTQGTSTIMRSIDGGQTWTKVQETNGSFEQIIATPGNFSVQYASENGVGVWKSTDGGATWTLSNNGMSPSGRIEIGVSSVNPSRLFASAEGSLSGEESDLYTSTNAGSNWSLVDIKFNSSTVDFLGGQGFYDNAVLPHPFNENEVYFGGVSLFKTALTTGSSTVNFFKLDEVNTNFIFLQAFSNVTEENGRLSLGDFHNNITVEIRFGTGESQKAHRFLTPAGATSGVASADYSFSSYVTVPFEVWDVVNNRQLMVSFRDQNRNGKFDLITSDLSNANAVLQSREYLYIHNVAYSATQSSTIAVAGGQEFQLMYNIFPALAASAIWDENNLPVSKIVINAESIQKLNATTVTVADGRGTFDNKNKSDQVDLSNGVHPDHHFMIPLITSVAAKTFRIVLSNDGGVFVSKSSTSPGTTDGDWSFKGLGLNTSQFYGADKNPGKDQYIGGMQDNGTRYSPTGSPVSATTNYTYALGGDGFEVLWNSKDPLKILGSVYNGQISQSTNGGTSWADAVSGFTPSATEFSFFTKLSNSKEYPDRVFTVGLSGVYRSENFGTSWTLTSIPSNFIIGSPFYLDVEVSRANANIVWAGSGMNNTATTRNLFVSTDGGKTFNATNNYTITPLGNITKLACHPTQPNTAFALFSFAKSPKILRTTDLGQTWQDISGFETGTASTTGFPDVAVYCLYVRPDNPDIIWVGTEIGIVESQDNGATWSLLADFPNVGVWDMKGQDNEIVLATHGRGIWRAVVASDQQARPSPEILAAGTSPQKKLMVRMGANISFDSVQLYDGATRLTSRKNVTPGTFDFELAGISPGAKDLKLLGYIGGAPVQSLTHKMVHQNILTVKNSYSTYFSVVNDLSLDGMSLQQFTGLGTTQRKTLQTNHSYSTSTSYQVLVKTPITVASDAPFLYYSDIGVIEPGNDFIIAEATRNGLDWIPLAPQYDAGFPGDATGAWMNAYLSKASATAPMFIDHQIDISQTFSAGEVLLFRFRMESSETTTAWGWAMNYISIQEPPLGTELTSNGPNASIYPNPAQGEFNLQLVSKTSAKISVTLTDTFGKRIVDQKFESDPGNVQTVTIALPKMATGIYPVVVEMDGRKKVVKLFVRQ